MSLSRWIAEELGHPSIIVGRMVLGPLWNRRNAALNDAAFDALALSAQDRVLEVGFGGGYLLGRVSAVVTAGLVAGVDVSMGMVRAAQRHYRRLIQRGVVEVKHGDAEALPYPTSHFTKACSVNSIFYWQDAPRAIRELARVLSEGGLLVLCFTCRESLADRDFAESGLALYEKEEVERMMAEAGFDEMQAVEGADRHRQFLCLSGRKAA